MIYATARYANVEHTQVTGTDANGNSETVPHDHKLFRQPDDGPLGFVAAGGVIAPFQAPPAPPKTKLYKSTLVRRMSREEAEAFEAMLAAEEAWFRMLYNSVEWFDVSDALVTYLHYSIVAHTGETRAGELLQPEE